MQRNRNLAAIALAKSPPDSYMLGIGATGAITINPNIPDAPPLDPQKQLAPAGLPPALATRLSKEVQAILARPEIQARVLQLGAEPAYLDIVAFRSFIVAESQQWKTLIATIALVAK